MQGVVASRSAGLVCKPRLANVPSGIIRSMATVADAPKRSHGGLRDQDRIFQNLYGHHDFRLKGALARGDWHRTRDIIDKGHDFIINQMKASGIRGRGAVSYTHLTLPTILLV